MGVVITKRTLLILPSKLPVLVVAFCASANLYASFCYEIRGLLQQSNYFMNIDQKSAIVPLGPAGDIWAELVRLRYYDGFASFVKSVIRIFLRTSVYIYTYLIDVYSGSPRLARFLACIEISSYGSDAV